MAEQEMLPVEPTSDDIALAKSILHADYRTPGIADAAILDVANHRIAATKAADERARVLSEHLADQITHAETRIQDGIEMGATVWRIALEDIVRENRAALAEAGGRHG